MITKTTVAAFGVGIILFGVFSIARERLVPFTADYERAAWRLTGDEPAYLLTAQAIASGDGENVRNVNERRTYTNFQSRVVIGANQWTWQNYKALGVRHLIDRSQSWGNKQVIQRPPLIALFCAPFVLKPAHVRWSILFAQGMAISVIAALLIMSVGFTDLSRLGLGAFAAVAFLVGMPVAYYATQVFPEVLMGGLLAASLLFIRKKHPCFHWLGYVLMYTCLWGSARVLAGVAIVSLLYLWRDVRDRDWVGAGVVLLGWVSYVGYNLWLCGDVVPPNPDKSSPLTLALLPKGALIDLFSNDVGLLFLSPVTWVGLVCAMLIVFRCRRDRGTFPSILLLAGVVGVVGAFPNYRAGVCPAGRYQVAQCFLLLIPVFIFLSAEASDSKWLSRVKTSLLLLGAVTLVMGIVVATDPTSWYERYNPLFRWKLIQPYYYMLPDFYARWLGHVIVWLCVFMVAIFLGDILRWIRRCCLTTAFRILPRKCGKS